jgi:hypothetical protein
MASSAMLIKRETEANIICCNYSREHKHDTRGWSQKINLVNHNSGYFLYISAQWLHI